MFPATRTPPPQPLSEPEPESLAAMSQPETELVAAPVELVMHCAKISPCTIISNHDSCLTTFAGILCVGRTPLK